MSSQGRQNVKKHGLLRRLARLPLTIIGRIRNSQSRPTVPADVEVPDSNQDIRPTSRSQPVLYRVPTPSIGPLDVIIPDQEIRPAKISQSFDRVPLEIQEYMMGFLYEGHIYTLQAAMVCRAWYPHAITVFYEIIMLRHSRQVDKLAWLVLNVPRVRQQLVATRKVYLHNNSCTPTFPLVLAAALPSLQVVLVDTDGAPWSKLILRSDFLRAFPRHLSTISELDLRMVSLYNIHDLQRLLLSLSNLTHLTIGRVDFRQESRAIGTASPSRLTHTAFPRLRTLVLLLYSFDASPRRLYAKRPLRDARPSHRVALIRWLISTPICDSVSFIRLRDDVHQSAIAGSAIDSGLTGEINQLIQRAGRSLRTLQLDIACLASLADYDLSHNEDLVHIRFTLVSEPSWDHFVDQLLSILSGINASCIENIETSIWHRSLGEKFALPIGLPDPYIIHPLHQIMESSKYEGLLDVNIAFRLMLTHDSSGNKRWRLGGDPPDYDGMRVLFAPWEKRRLLRLTYVPLIDYHY
ncbi:uncharacterized protein C8Q71DRAFT_854441 [Rhodofomes roseus]|uniref:F-box domain-containing protein n=2 Tax=Rhodofomes roseus TaxID=34475 RepID=A0ABQ8KQD7_9APHY|nr:uncharacterized protein C8Q71DRAFT_854441 [Rhodofomes roseus]KAH9840554.1 hypothetical protein C8Q71DRAFT_854441 [Rhodofomes roseus]